MKDFLEVITNRRSIRKFTDQKVEPHKLDRILEAACAAPSAKNVRPCRFLVLDKPILEELADGLTQKEPFKTAAFGIAVCVDVSSYELGDAWLEDGGAAMENMLLAAVAMDLGALWFGVYKREPKNTTVREILKIPYGVEVQGIILTGYPDEKQEPHSGIDKTRVKLGRWTD